MELINNFETIFEEELQNCYKYWEDEDMGKMMLQKCFDGLFYEENPSEDLIKKVATNFQEKKWDILKNVAHTLKGRILYLGFTKFPEIFHELQDVCEEGEEHKIGEKVKVVMLLLNKLNIYLMKQLGGDKPLYPFDPKFLGGEEKSVKKEKKADPKENKATINIFDEEGFKKAFDDDRIASRFAIIGFCKDFFEKEGELEKMIVNYQNDKIKVLKGECENLLKKIENLKFQNVSSSLNKIITAVNKNENYSALFKEFLQNIDLLFQTLASKFALDDLSFTFKEEFLKKKPKILNEEAGLKNFGNLSNLKRNVLAWNEETFSHNGNIIKMISLKNNSKFSEVREIATYIQEKANEIGFTNYGSMFDPLKKAAFLFNEDDVSTSLKLVCIASKNVHLFIMEYLSLEKEVPIDFEAEFNGSLKPIATKFDQELSNIEEQINDEEKISEKNLEAEIPGDFKHKNHRNFKSIDFEIDSSDDQIFFHEKKFKFSMFPKPSVKSEKELGRNLKNFNLYFTNDFENEEYPFDSGLKCILF